MTDLYRDNTSPAASITTLRLSPSRLRSLPQPSATRNLNRSINPRTASHPSIMYRPAKKPRTKAEEQLVECIRCGTLTNHELDQCDECRRALASIPRGSNRRSRGSHPLQSSELPAPDDSTASNSIPPIV